VIAALVAVVALAGCGSGGHSRTVRLMLDFTPNAAHAGIYAAVSHGYDRQAGITLRVIPPPSPADSIKLLEAGRVDFSVLDIHDLAIAREHGAHLVGVMAIVEQPLAAVIAQPQVRSPAALQGKTVGVTGVPSDLAVLGSTVRGAGGDPRRVKTVTIGGNAVPDLLAGRVAAATAFWNDEGVALQRARPGFHVFRVDRYGAPSYPELVLCVRRSTLTRNPSIVRTVVRVLERGYLFTIAHPSTSAKDLEDQVAGLNRQLVDADLAALRPAFAGPNGRPGELDPQVLRAWSAWEVRFGLVKRRPDVAQAFAISR
jgi:NitT/TauT family transport system substrate-binding protein/putative hydroxymethylpyrimidine transport system substrate-binding protein